MKIKALLVAFFLAGIAASLALAKAPKPPKPTKASKPVVTATTAAKPKCNQVEFKGNATAGSVTFTVTKSNKRGRNLVGTAVTLTIPPGAKIKAKACTISGSTALTLRDLHAKVPPAKP